MTPCLRVEEYAVGLDRPGAEEHLRECVRCRAALERVREIEKALRSSDEEESVTAAEIRSGLEQVKYRLARKKPWKEVLPMAAAAAILLGIIAWVSGVFSSKPIPPRPQENTPAADTNRREKQEEKERVKLKAKLAALDEAIRLTPANANLYLDRAEVHLLLRDANSAIADCTQAIEIDPTVPEAYTRRAEARLATGNFLAAVEDCDRSLQLDPRGGRAYIARGEARVALGNVDAAIADFSRAIELKPNDPDAFRGRGDARAKTDREGALEDYRKALDLAPSDWPHRAKVERALGMHPAKLLYRVQFPEKFEGDRKAILAKTRDIVTKRINQRGLKEPSVTTLGDDGIVIQVALEKREDLAAYKDLLARAGKLEFRVVADPKIQDDWKAKPKEPAPIGWTACKMKDSDERLLCAEVPLITGADIKHASHSVVQRVDKVDWKVDFQLTDEGAKKFDAAAAKLYNPEESLRGRIAIIMDEQILSHPTVNSEAFHGAGEITGNFDQRDAENLAITLRSGSLPFPLKRESEEFEGPK